MNPLRLLPPWLLVQARRLCCGPLELAARLLGGGRPPRWLHPVGGGDFDTVGARFLGHFRTLAGLLPDEAVLDVGCGVGRMALPLTGYLSPPGSYRGFDVAPAAVRWCRRRITPVFPHFQFSHADVHNPAYNPAGRTRAEKFTFPYPDGVFDFALATSVFTHMLPAEVARYLAELARVLRPGGRCLATFFVIDEESRALVGRPDCPYPFRPRPGGCWTTRQDLPQAAVAYDEEAVLALLRRAGLELRRPIQRGAWCGRPAVEGQDLVLLGRSA
jgi:SAM-dependent methyltransferase